MGCHFVLRKHVSRFYFVFVCVICLSSLSKAQTGLPNVLNYTKNIYGEAGRNWSACTDSTGCIYFGNSNGLLRFNGSGWKLYPIPGNKIIRSVKSIGDRIYVGSYCEFGYFKKDEYGTYIYTSLSDSLTNFVFRNQEIWDIVKHENKIYFRSFTSYFVYDGSHVTAKKLTHSLLYLGSANNKLYAYIKDIGFCLLKNKHQEVLISDKELFNDKVVAVFPVSNGLLLVTSKNGIFHFDGNACQPWKNEVDLQLRNKIVNRAIITKDSTYIIGTISDGIFAISKEGKILWHINTQTGLNNNTILGLCCDNDNNIWAALDDGIAYVGYNSQLRFIKNSTQDIGYVYDVALKDNILYIATNQGVFSYNNRDNNPVFEQIQGVKEQSWSLSVFDNQLFCGNNEGTYKITGNTAKKLNNIGGGTSMKKVSFYQEEVLIQSTYTHLVIYRKNASGEWMFSHVVKNFTQPLRSIEIDSQNNIWASHFYTNDLYKIVLSQDLKSTDSVRIFSSLHKNSKSEQIHLFKFKGRIVCNDDFGFYTFDDLTDSIKPYDLLNEKLMNFKDIRKSIPAGKDTYWLVRNGEFILMRFENQNIDILQRMPFSLFNYALADNEENMVYFSDSCFVFCVKNGVAVWNSDISPYKVEKKYNLLIEKIFMFDNKEVVKRLPIQSNEKISIPFRFNSLSFWVACPASPEKEVKFLFKLEGKDNEFTAFSLLERNTSFSFQGKKEYYNLSSGEYVFHAVATDNLGNILATTTYKFEIEDPLYASNMAYICYFLFTIGLIIVLRSFIKNQIRKSKLKIEIEQRKLRQAELEAQEKEILQLKNEKLETDLTFKSKELASSTMSTIKKNEILIDIKNELSEQKGQLGTQYPNKYYEKLVKMIDNHLDSEDDWSIFQTNFDRIHENFFRNLKLKYPDLTPTDLKFCALLRLNMTTKEIANLMNITVKGVERGRNRLRKKLDLAPETNLIDFMIGFK